MCPQNPATLLLWAVVSLWACSASLLADDSPPAGQPSATQGEKPTRKIRSSEKTVVKDVVYGLEAEGSRLYLTSQPLDGADRKAKRRELQFTAAEGGDIVEISLSRRGIRNLMSVIKLARGDEFEFHCLILGAEPGGHVRDGFRIEQTKFFATKDDLKILAADSKHFSGRVFIVLGDMDYDDGKDAMITTGIFYFCGCFPLNQGQLSPFRVESVPLGAK
ncbi:MAG: hypothetical protein JSS02_30620 [Planctomycetes bacterium]|nr:hypothetical protein [Planctomycetota bacterium]